MLILEPGAIDRILAGEPVSHRLTALRHASTHNRPGLRGDHAARPSSVVWLRPGDGGVLEAFGAGEPGPALDWIEASVARSTVALLAPGAWEPAVRARGGNVETASIATFIDYDLMMLPRFSPQSRRLTLDDASAFATIAPAWALRSWGDFASMIRSGLAIGLQSVQGFISVAWTYESDPQCDKIGAATLPPYRQLGLGRRVAEALIEQVVRDRRKRPIWVTGADNVASLALARSLGFANPAAETLLRWTPARG